MSPIKSAVLAVFLSLVFVLVHAEFKLPVNSIMLRTNAPSLNSYNIHKQLFINNNVSEGGPKNIYIDGRKGLDSNNGLTIDSPVKTVQRLLSLEVSPFDIINIARGSEFREELNLAGVSNITLKDYGTGPKPVFDCADIIANDMFSVAPEYPDVYKVNFTNEFIDYSQYSVWENNTRLVRAASISQCSSNPGSYYAPVPTPGSSDIIYIHASDNSNLLSNGKKYEIARRGYGIFLGDSCKAYNLHTRRNGANNGSFLSGQDSYLKGITAEDGVKHNLFMESGIAEECIAWKSDDPLVYGGATMFISYSHTGGNGTLTVSYKNCIVLAGMNGVAEYQPGMIGVYAHSSGLPYKKLSIDGGVFTRVNAAISGEVDTIDIRNANFYKCVYAVSKEGGTVRFENNIITQMPGRDAPISANVSSLSCNNNKFNLLPGCVTIQGNIKNLQANTNTVYSAGLNSTFVYSLAGANSKVELKNNLFFIDTARHAGVSILYQKDNFNSFPPTISSSNNHGVDIRYQLDYATHNLVSIQSWGKGYEAGSANDLGSTRFTGDYTSGDFFLSRLHPLYKSAGSENTFNQVSRYGIPFFYLSAGSWRWRNDNGSELQATWKGDQLKPVFINTVNETFRLRVEVFNDWFKIDANDSLQYSTSIEGPWLTIGENEADKAFVLGKTSLNGIDQEHTTAQLTSDSKYSFVPGLVQQNARTYCWWE